MWHLIETSGPKPVAIAHHTSIVFNERMYLFGGSHANGEDNRKFYSLDLKSFKWELVNSVRIFSTSKIYSIERGFARV